MQHSSSSTTTLIYYPAYCFPASPTLNTWARLTARDVCKLKEREGWEGQKIYFHFNHPIKWVRLVGVIVAFDEYPKRWVFVLDDSSGVNIEVTCARKPQPLSTEPVPGFSVTERGHGGGVVAEEDGLSLSKMSRIGATASGNKVDMTGVDLGTVVKVKGGIGEFRGERQVTLERINIITTTTDEAFAWTELADFYKSVLSRPWLLDPAEELRLKEEASGTKERIEKKKALKKRDHERKGKAKRKEKKKEEEAPKMENLKKVDRQRPRKKEDHIPDQKTDRPKDPPPQHRNTRPTSAHNNTKAHRPAQLGTSRGSDTGSLVEGGGRGENETLEQSRKDYKDPHSKPKISLSFLRGVMLWDPVVP